MMNFTRFALASLALLTTAASLTAPSTACAQGPMRLELTDAGLPAATEAALEPAPTDGPAGISSDGPAALTLVAAPLAVVGIAGFYVFGVQALFGSGPENDLEAGLAIGGLVLGLVGAAATIAGAIWWARTDRRRRELERGGPRILPVVSAAADGSFTAVLQISGEF